MGKARSEAGDGLRDPPRPRSLPRRIRPRVESRAARESPVRRTGQFPVRRARCGTIAPGTGAAGRGSRYAQAERTDGPPRDRDRVRGPGPGRGARARRARHHQPRHRPARLQDPSPHRRGGGQGPSRRPPRLHPRPRDPRPSRGGRGGYRGPPRGGGGPGADCGRAGRQGHDVLRDPHVRGARRGNHVPQPRLSHLRVGHRVQRRESGPDPALREPGLLLRRRRGARQHHSRDPPHHPQHARQPDRRGGPEERDRQARGGPRGASPGRGAERRDLLPHHLRRPRAREPPRLPRDRGSRDPPRRLEQDVRHDRMAARLRGVAGGPRGARDPARHQLPFVRQRPHPVRRSGGPRRGHRTRWARW